MAKKSTQRKTTKRKKSATASKQRLYITVIVITLAMLIPLTAYYIKHQNSTHTSSRLSKEQQLDKLITATSQSPQVQFDFYTVLPNAKSATKKHRAQLATSNKSARSHNYILQIASVRKYNDAARLSGELQTLGYRSFVQKYQADKATWYRVLAGPFQSRPAASQAQKRLSKDHLGSFLLPLNS